MQLSDPNNFCGAKVNFFWLPHDFPLRWGKFERDRSLAALVVRLLGIREGRLSEPAYPPLLLICP